MGRDHRCLVPPLGDAEEESDTIDRLDAAGCLVASGLVNAHHHMFQNLTRAFGLVEAAAALRVGAEPAQGGRRQGVGRQR
jgi:cytosine/adenosine deaminase-related metal-dependent hydrolase